MMDVTPPKQRAKNAKINAKYLMKQFASEEYGLQRHIELEIDRIVDDERLGALEAHIALLSTTNCWYAEYDVRQRVLRQVKRRRRELAAARDLLHRQVDS